MDNSNNKKNVLIVSIIAVAVALIAASFAYFGSLTIDVNNNLEVNITTENGLNSYIRSVPAELNLYVAPENMAQSKATNNVAAENNVLFNVAVNSGGVAAPITCTFDIVFEYDTSSDVYGVSPTSVSIDPDTTNPATKELTLTVDSETGNNYFNPEKNFNYDTTDGWVNASGSTGRKRILVHDAQITSVGTEITYSFNLDFKFYNLTFSQEQLAGKSFKGKVYADNASCGQSTLAGYIMSNYENLNGTDIIFNNPWHVVHQIIDEDSDNPIDAGYRYVGNNPSNYVLFNGEMWRIISVENTEYCTDNDELCTTTSIGPLVKIIRNTSFGNTSLTFDYKQNNVGSSLSSTGSSDWSDSQLMMLLNEPKYYKSGYNDNLQVHNDYSIETGVNTNSIKDSNGIVIYKNMGAYFNDNMIPYKPASTSTSGFTSTTSVTKCTDSSTTNCMKVLSSSAQNMVQAVKWYLHGVQKYNDATYNTPIGMYKIERGILIPTGSNVAQPMTNTRANQWYGKIGLMYPSDYGLATNGGENENDSYLRDTCLNNQMYGWGSGDLKTYCAYHSWIRLNNLSSNAISMSIVNQWTITPFNSTGVFYVTISSSVNFTNAGLVNGVPQVRPVLYLKPNVIIESGTGTYDDPYILK